MASLHDFTEADLCPADSGGTSCAFQNHSADLEIYIYLAGIRILISSGSICFHSLVLALSISV